MKFQLQDVQIIQTVIYNMYWRNLSLVLYQEVAASEQVRTDPATVSWVAGSSRRQQLLSYSKEESSQQLLGGAAPCSKGGWEEGRRQGGLDSLTCELLIFCYTTNDPVRQMFSVDYFWNIKLSWKIILLRKMEFP